MRWLVCGGAFCSPRGVSWWVVGESVGARSGPPSVALRHLPPEGGENFLLCGGLSAGGVLLASGGEVLVGSRGVRRCSPAAPLCRVATSPPGGGRKFLLCGGLSAGGLVFSPLGGEGPVGRRGGRLCSPRPPSVALRHLPPEGGENFCACDMSRRLRGENVLALAMSLVACGGESVGLCCWVRALGVGAGGGEWVVVGVEPLQDDFLVAAHRLFADPG